VYLSELNSIIRFSFRLAPGLILLGTIAAGANASAVDDPVVPPSTVAADYVIGPGDTIQVFVWRNPDLTVTVPVRPDGKISTPLVEDMVAVGKTPSGLARDIEKALSQYVKAPQVNVIVTQPMSVFSQVKVIGQVLKPQSVPYREGMTVLDAVLAVGGLGQFAAGNRAHIERVVGGKTEAIKVKLDALVNDGDMKQNIKLLPGDVLVVPESRF
jgi:polysaccharide export outer membrane protein